jgi:hypothetical protein
MKHILLAGASVLALSAASPSAFAGLDTYSYAYTGTFETLHVTDSGTYDIVAYGAQGGGANGNTGGYGAKAESLVTLTAGETLSIAVGGAGGSGNYGGGGGGGSFIAAGSTALVVAGGGGGAFWTGNGLASAATGGLGLGGAASNAGGGGGFLGSGSTYSGPLFTGGTGGGGFAAGLQGGGSGGFGGGGGVNDTLSYFGGGGGGGYTGGDGGGSAAGGGGTSFGQTITGGVNSGNGSITITETSSSDAVPEPGSIALLSAGLAGLGMIRRRVRS